MNVSEIFAPRKAIRVLTLSALVIGAFGLAATPASAAPEGGTIVVSVTYPGGVPATDGCVSVWENVMTGIGDDVCDQASGVYYMPIPHDGAYSIDFIFAGAPPQTYRQTNWWWPDYVEVAVAGGATVYVNYQLVTTQWAITGTLTTSAAAPAENWRVALLNSSGLVMEEMTVDSTGWYGFSGIAGGNFHLGFAPPVGDPNSDWWSVQWYDGATSYATSTAISVAGDDFRVIDYQLDPVGDEPAENVVTKLPVRILDTSSFTPGVVRCYPVVGWTAGVPTDAVGVLLNVTAVGPTGNGYVVVYPDSNGDGATPPPLASTVNFEPGKDVANSAIVELPANGEVCAFSAGGTLSRLILDVAGYVVPGSGITMQSAQRLLDTRAPLQQVTGPVVPETVYDVQVTGNAGVPAGATAVLANITVTGVTDGGHLRVWEAGTTVPNTSVVNYAPGQTKANGQIIALSPTGALSLESFTGKGVSTNPVQVIIDVVGYVEAGSQFVATDPTRIVETRVSEGIVGPIPGQMVPNTVYPVELDDLTLIPAGATSVVLNVTVVGPTAFGNLRVYPDTNGLGTTTPPNSSVINYIPGRAIPNMVIVQIPPDRMIDFYNNMGLTSSRTDLIVDVIGYINGGTI